MYISNEDGMMDFLVCMYILFGQIFDDQMYLVSKKFILTLFFFLKEFDMFNKKSPSSRRIYV